MKPPGQMLQRFRRVNAPLLAAALSTALCAGLIAAHRASIITIPGLDSWELATIDARFRVRGERTPLDDDSVIVALDDATRAGAPEVFQTRRGWARLIEALAGYRPAAIAVDAFFANPEVNLSEATQELVREAHAELSATAVRTPALEAATRALAAVVEETRGDELLADAVAAAGSITLGMFFELDGDPAAPGIAERPGLGRARVADGAVIPQPASHSPPRASHVTVSLPPIASAARSGGHVNVDFDHDGSVRTMPLVIEHGGRLYQSLALTMVTHRLAQKASYASGDQQLGLGDVRVPVSSQARAYLNFLGPSATFPHISAVHVLSGEAPASALEGKTVFVGYTDRARDKVITPFDSAYDGVELHATLAHNIVHNQLLTRTGALLTIFNVMLLGGLLTLLQLRRIRQRRAWLVGLVAAAAVVAQAAAAQMLFSNQQLIIEVVAPCLAAAVIALASLTTSLATEGREKANLRAAFSQYVQDTLVDKILADPDKARLGGVRRELTVLFSDIRDFSRFAERLEPETLSDFLNEYFTPMTELVMDNHGMLDKYIGDAIMAVYGAPLALEDHARRACRAALGMIAAIEPLNRDWRQRSLPEIAIGIGINTGPMSVGNMGSEARFDYTVLGDAVNLGARLESLTKEYRVAILVGERTAELAGDDFVFRELDRVRAKGRQGVVSVYELLGSRGNSPLPTPDLELFAAALGHYRDQNWDAARGHFTLFAQKHPDDGPAAVYLQRIDRLSEHPPGHDWEGVFDQRQK